MLLVGEPRPGIWPIRLPIRMKTKSVPSSGRYLRPFGPMLSSSTPTKNDTMSSRTICSLPGLSTLNCERMARPMDEDEQRDQPDEDHVVGRVNPQRREQRVDERDERGGMFNGFHSLTLY